MYSLYRDIKYDADQERNNEPDLASLKNIQKKRDLLLMADLTLYNIPHFPMIKEVFETHKNKFIQITANNPLQYILFVSSTKKEVDVCNNGEFQNYESRDAASHAIYNTPPDYKYEYHTLSVYE
jgi:hypothetical protein